MITQQRLKELLHYDVDSGVFTQKLARRGVKVGAPTGEKMRDGYIRICVDNARYPAHRLAWLYVMGAFPEHEIDHINGIRFDNRISNLRVVTRSQNKQNMLSVSGSKSGIKGAHWESKRKRWRAALTIDGTHVFLGRYKTAKEAHIAYCRAAAIYHTHNPVAQL